METSMRVFVRLLPAALLGLSWMNAGAAQMPVDVALTRQIEAERTAHLTYDAELLVDMMADDFTLVDSGEVMRPARAQSLARFRQYFGSVVFRAWDDIAPPVVMVSADGTMATVLVTKFVRTVRRAEAANPRAQVTEARFAWLETWRREPAGWRLAQLASTRSPDGQSASAARR